MVPLLQFLEKYQMRVYLVLGGLGLIYLRRVLGGFQEYRSAQFGLGMNPPSASGRGCQHDGSGRFLPAGTISAGFICFSELFHVNRWLPQLWMFLQRQHLQ